VFLEEDMSKEELLAKIIEQAAEIQQLRDKKFGLVWEDKPDAQVIRASNETPVLREDRSKAVVTDEKATNHVLINGDNYHALTALQATHTGKIDVIYIDPPYNTGNKDFIYNDSYLDKEDTYRHSKWLSFMEKRLILAKELLTDSGIIFVSIDDNEQAHLKLLMDEIFEPNNFLSTMIWDKANTKNDAENFQRNHEYIHVYGKTSKTKVTRYVEEERKVVSDGVGYYIREGLTMGGGYGGTLNGRPNLGYTLYYNPVTGDIKPVQDQNLELARTSNNEDEVYETREDLIELGYIPVRPRKNGTKLGCWKWGFEKMQADLYKVFFTETKGSYTAAYKRYQDANKVVQKGTDFWLADTVKRNVRSVINFSNGEGIRTLKNMFGTKPFDHPKNLNMIKYFIEITDNKNAVVLDFFAGSGTTAHAVAELNKEDGGTRQCILVTDGGKTETTGESGKNTKGEEVTVNIAEEVTYERVRRALTGENWAQKKKPEPLGGNLRYFKVELIPDSDEPTGENELNLYLKTNEDAAGE
jgi:adenine-specific DNA-methyltransferase